MRILTIERGIPLLVSVALLGACSNDMGGKQTGGAVLGGAAGALAGSQFGGGTGRIATTALGTLLGAYAGSEAGKSLDKADKMHADRAGQQALETSRVGQAVPWSNPDTGNSGVVTPTRTFQTASGENCREYTEKVMIGGKEETAYGTACRQPDGSWKILK
jgi:surface antigen